MISFNFTNNFFHKKKNINFFFFLIFLTLLLLACYKVSHITYYFSDNIFLNYVHNLSKIRGFFDILIEKNNVLGLPIIPHNPYLNLLSFFNYDLIGFAGYFSYQIIFRLLELLVFCIAIWALNEKISIWHFLIFFALIFHFNVFDHQSYINFPILIFNFFILLSIKFEKNYYLIFLFVLVGSFWSFFINPMYFFITSFGPMSFLIMRNILKKNIQFLFFSMLAFVPFVIMYVLLVLGTARFALSNYVISETSNIYNFTIINSKLLIIIISFLILKYFYLKKFSMFKDINFSILNFFLILSLIFGFIFKYKIINWNLPHPIYIDYSLQYIYLAIISCCLLSGKFKHYISKSFIVFIFCLKLPSYYPLDFKKKEDLFPFEYRYFWEKNKRLNIDESLLNKNIYINFPNKGSQFTEYLKIKDLIMRNYITDFKSSLNWSDFYEANYYSSYGHSLLLGINTFLVTNLKKEILYKNTVPKVGLDYKYLDILNLDIILSDIELKNYELIKKVNLKNFNLFLYKTKKKEFKERCILKVNRTEFNKILFIASTLKKNKNCLAVFSIPFSYTNNFSINNKIVKTEKFEKYWHSIYLKDGDIVSVSKKSFFAYLLSSYRDYKEFKINQ